MKIFGTVLLLFVIGAAGCAPLITEPTAVLETATLTASPTATIDWFPATDTPTLAPTIAVTATPTPNLGLGESLLTDDFSQSGAWQTYQTTNGSAGYGDHEFTLAVAAPKGYLTSLRNQPDLGNFYLGVTANPSLCQAGDSYGLLFRALNEWTYYRWVITCDGQTRLERVKDGYAVLILDWIYSAQIWGAGAEMRLGVWIVGDQMRFFIDGVEQFSAHDPVLTSGLIGFYARAGSDSPLTVNFSDLSVRAVSAAALPTSTPTASATLRPAPK